MSNIPSKNISHDEGIQAVTRTLMPTPIISIPDPPHRLFIFSPVLCYYIIQMLAFWLMVWYNVSIYQQKEGLTVKNKIIAFLRKYNIFDIFVLSGGMAISQLIKILIQPIASRIYTPAQFGVFTLIHELSNMFVVLATLQYDICIVTAKTDEDADKITGVSFYLLFITTVLFALGVGMFNIFSPETYAGAGPLIYCSVLLFFFVGFSQILNSYNNRYGKYKLMSSVAIISSVVYAGLKIGLGFLGVGTVGLVISALATDVVGIRQMSKKIVKNIKRIFSVTFAEAKVILKENISQPLAHAPGLFLLSYSFTVIPIFLLSLYNDVAEIGFYSQATAILGLPLTIISNSVSKVFFKNACTEMNDIGNFKKSFKNTAFLLLGISVIPFILIYILAPWAFGFFFGSQWIRSGHFVRLLIPLYFTRFISTSVNCGLIVCKKQKMNLILHSFLLVISFVTYLISKNFELNIEQFLLMTSISYSVLYLIKFGFIYKFSKGVK